MISSPIHEVHDKNTNFKKSKIGFRSRFVSINIFIYTVFIYFLLLLFIFRAYIYKPRSLLWLSVHLFQTCDKKVHYRLSYIYSVIFVTIQ